MLAAVLADDTTGALEVGALLASCGVNARVVLGSASEDADAVAVDLATRHLPAADAAAIVDRAARTARAIGVEWLYKKTDSTLRGNIGAEVAALIAAMPDRPLVYVPAYPALGRTVRNGSLYVEGIPVDQTAFARDAREPVQDASIPRLLEAAGVCDLEIAPDHFALRGALPNARVIVCDGVCESDLSAVAAVLTEWGGRFIGVGPGGFARYWCRMLPLTPTSIVAKPKVSQWMLVCGSLHPAARRQMAPARSRGLAVLATSDAVSDDPEAEAARLATEAASAVRAGKADGLILFGGDTARAVLDALGCRSLRPLGECVTGVPLSVAETAHHDIPIVSKAGGFGGPDVLADILDSLRQTT